MSAREQEKALLRKKLALLEGKLGKLKEATSAPTKATAPLVSSVAAPPQQRAPTALCRFFTRGYCALDTACTFRHVGATDGKPRLVAAPNDKGKADEVVKKEETAKPEAVKKAAMEQQMTPANYQPGDWTCPSCGLNCFARKLKCYRCRAPRPIRGAAAAGGDLSLRDELTSLATRRGAVDCTNNATSADWERGAGLAADPSTQWRVLHITHVRGDPMYRRRQKGGKDVGRAQRLWEVWLRAPDGSECVRHLRPLHRKRRARDGDMLTRVGETLVDRGGFEVFQLIPADQVGRPSQHGRSTSQGGLMQPQRHEQQQHEQQHQREDIYILNRPTQLQREPRSQQHQWTTRQEVQRPRSWHDEYLQAMRAKLRAPPPRQTRSPRRSRSLRRPPNTHADDGRERRGRGFAPPPRPLASPLRSERGRSWSRSRSRSYSYSDRSRSWSRSWRSSSYSRSRSWSRSWSRSPSLRRRGRSPRPDSPRGRSPRPDSPAQQPAAERRLAGLDEGEPQPGASKFTDGPFKFTDVPASAASSEPLPSR